MAGPPAAARALALAVLIVSLGYVLVAHLPWPLDPAIGHPLVHLGLHAGFFLAGALLGLAWPAVGPVTKALVIVLAMSAMSIISLVEITGGVAYLTYPGDQVAAAGLVMLAGMAVFWICLAVSPALGRVRWPRRLAALAGSALLLGLIGLSYLAG